MSQNENNCQYTDGFTDTITKEFCDYSCTRLPLDSGFCEFHDRNFLNGNEDFVRNLFEVEVNASLNPPNELLCIGFHLPTIDLHNLRFQKPVYFVNTKFHGDVNILNSTFASISFYKSEFLQNASFSNLEFSENFIFSDVQSLVGDMDFQNVIFNKQSSFNRLRSKNISFKKCNFSITNFRGAQFNKITKFLETSFLMQADFSVVKFGEKADFPDTTFSDTTFSQNANFKFSKFDGVTKFHNIDFKTQELVIFDGDLSEVSFKDTNITRIKFDEKIIWGNSDRYEVYDARELIKNPENFGLGSVLSVYRSLRENYEFRLMYDEAGQFFVREMELRRNYHEDPNDDYKTKLRPIYHRYLSLTSFYSYLSKYGESVKRTFFWAGLIFLLASVYYWFYPDLHTVMTNYSLTDVEHASKIVHHEPLIRLKITLERTFSSFFQIESKDLADYLVKISSIPVLGNLFIVLRRRFERRFRH